MERLWIVVVSLLLTACVVEVAGEAEEADKLAEAEQDLRNSLGRYVATGLVFSSFGTALDDISLTHTTNGAGQRIRETYYASGRTHLLRPRWSIGGLPAAGGAYTIKVVARKGETTGDARFRLFYHPNTAGPVYEFRLDGSGNGATCGADSTAWRTCRAFYNKPSNITTLYVSSQDIDNTTADTTPNTLIVDSIEVIPGTCPTC